MYPDPWANETLGRSWPQGVYLQSPLYLAGIASLSGRVTLAGPAQIQAPIASKMVSRAGYV